MKENIILTSFMIGITIGIICSSTADIFISLIKNKIDKIKKDKKEIKFGFRY